MIARNLRFAAVLSVALQIACTPLLAQAPALPIEDTARPRVPAPDTLRILIRITLIALNQANQTGNYTVLRDLAAPDFSSANSAAKLVEAFADLRRRNVDLSPMVLIEPMLVRPATINDQNMLRITGFFPTHPERINFDLVFQPVQGQWRLFGLSANTSPASQDAPASSNTVPKPDTTNPGKPEPELKPKREEKKPTDAATAKPTAPGRKSAP